MYDVWVMTRAVRTCRHFLRSFADGLSGESGGCTCGRRAGNREMGGGGGGTSGARYSLFSLLKFAECE